MKKKSPPLDEHQLMQKSWRLLLSLIQLFTLALIVAFCYLLVGSSLDGMFTQPTINLNISQQSSVAAAEDNRVVNGIHLATGMVYDENFAIVKATCTACHSSKLVTQNRATRDGWQQMIHWMQETQGLWDLGANEPIILDYLAEHYAPKEVGRRASLKEVEWYILELE